LIVAPGCQNQHLEYLETLTKSNGISPIYYKSCFPNLKGKDALCKNVAMALKDPLFNNEILHNTKALRNVYTNTGVMQSLVANFKPSYISDRHKTVERNEGKCKRQNDASKYTNWCFVIDLENRSEHYNCKIDSSEKLSTSFNESKRRPAWFEKIDNFVSSLSFSHDYPDLIDHHEELNATRKFDYTNPTPIPTGTKPVIRRASAA
jgi:hypothetical protein